MSAGHREFQITIERSGLSRRWTIQASVLVFVVAWIVVACSSPETVADASWRDDSSRAESRTLTVGNAQRQYVLFLLADCSTAHLCGSRFIARDQAGSNCGK